MRRITLFLFACVFSLSFASVKNSYAEDKIWTFGTDQGLYSDYTWRGTYINKTAWQGDVYLTLWDNLSFNVWWNSPTQRDNADRGKFTEVDYTVDYAFSYDAWSFDVGHIIFDFPQTAAGSPSSTNELFLTVGYDMIFSPTLGIYWDYDQTEGVYIQFDVSHSIEVSEWASLGLGVTQGFAIDEGPDNKAGNWAYYDKNNGFTSTELAVGMDFALGYFSSIMDVATLSVGGVYIARNGSMISGNSAGSPAAGNDDFVTSVNLNIEF